MAAKEEGDIWGGGGGATKGGGVAKGVWQQGQQRKREILGGGATKEGGAAKGVGEQGQQREWGSKGSKRGGAGGQWEHEEGGRETDQ